MVYQREVGRESVNNDNYLSFLFFSSIVGGSLGGVTCGATENGLGQINSLVSSRQKSLIRSRRYCPVG